MCQFRCDPDRKWNTANQNMLNGARRKWLRGTQSKQLYWPDVDTEVIDWAKAYNLALATNSHARRGMLRHDYSQFSDLFDR